MTVLGVDACKRGWVAVELVDGGFAAAYLVTNLAELADRTPPARVIGVDMPLGLVERGWRAADLAAAAVLGPRRGSVFRVPPRAVWDEPERTGAGETIAIWA